ncbi:MAG: hypothetical protein ACJ74O_19310 [Frankiaceae bacterium]
MMQRQDVVTSLKSYRDELREELSKVETALAALDALDGPTGQVHHQRAGADSAPAESSSSAAVTRRGGSASGTFDLLRAIFQDKPDLVLDAATAHTELQNRGWKSDAEDPVNAIRTALARLEQWDELTRVGRGKYRLRSEEEREADELQKAADYVAEGGDLGSKDEEREPIDF